MLKLVDETASDDDDFGVELDDQLPTSLQTMKLTERHLADGNTLRDIQLPDGSLVMLVKRGSNYMVPNGRIHLHPHDILLIISDNKKSPAK